MNKSTVFWIVTGCFILLVTLDIVNTTYLLNNGAVELNPVMRPYAYSLPHLVFIKALMCSAVILLAIWVDKKVHGFGNIIMTGVFLESGLLLVINLLDIFRLLP